MKEREKLNLTKSQGLAIVGGDDPNFQTIQNKIVDSSRWSIMYEIVVQRKLDGKFFMDSYNVGATEQQDEGPYDYSDPNFEEVFPVQKMITDYE